VGKGTFAGRLAPILGVPAISTGDIIREEIKGGTELGLRCKAFTSTGQLVPDEVVSAMVRKRLQAADAQNGWILVRGDVAPHAVWQCAQAAPSHATTFSRHSHRTATPAQWGRPRTWTLPSA
jgi:hypothetical protein